MEQKSSPPAMMRRQSLPEELLTSTQNRAFMPNALQADFHDSSSSSNVALLTANPNTDINFKRSENNRFGRQSKRKSQSLYESCGQDFKNLSLPKGEQSFVQEPFPILSRVHSSPPGSTMFPHTHQMLKSEKQAEEVDYDFLLQQQQQHTLFTHPATNPVAAKDVNMGYTDRLKLPSGLETPTPLHGVFEPSYSGQKFEHHSDDFQHNIHQNFIPNQAQQSLHYSGDSFAVNPMNGFHFQGMSGPFPINPLNNFGHAGHGGLHGYAPLPVQNVTEALNQPKSEAKRRRSRVPSSQYRGVSRCGKDNKFQARIRVQGKVKYLGRFKNEIEAAKCYDKHAIEYLGVNAQTNFPLPGDAEAASSN